MDPTRVLEVWEQCSGKNNLYSGLAMASLIPTSTSSMEEIATWSIEKRDLYLFQLRKLLFGKRFVNNANCPNCNDCVEWTMDYEQFKVPELEEAFEEQKFLFKDADFNVQYRLPTTNDLTTNKELKIIENCIISCTQGSKELSISDVPDLIKKALLTQMEQKSLLSNIIIALNCKECDFNWTVTFDIIPYLWAEIDQWSKRFLNQVFVLAKAFGWTESAIINMSQTRRNYYLNLLNS